MARNIQTHAKLQPLKYARLLIALLALLVAADVTLKVAINESLRGIPEEKVRFHTCYGINEGPDL